MKWFNYLFFSVTMCVLWIVEYHHSLVMSHSGHWNVLTIAIWSDYNTNVSFFSLGMLLCSVRMQAMIIAYMNVGMIVLCSPVVYVNSIGVCACVFWRSCVKSPLEWTLFNRLSILLSSSTNICTYRSACHDNLAISSLSSRSPKLGK